MKKTFIKLTACVAALALLISAQAVSGLFANRTGEPLGRAAADSISVEYVSEALESEYPLNASVTIPAARIDLGGGYKVNTTSALVLFPSGEATMSGTVRLTEAGRYTVTYSATDNGKIVKASVYFTALRDAFSVSGKKSSAYYGTHANGDTGIIASIARGDTFTYAPILNLSDNTKANTLIRLSAPADTVGTANASQIILTFTDIYQPDNRIKIYIRNQGQGGVYVYAETGGQPAVGVEWHESGNGKGIVHKGDNLGGIALFTQTGHPEGQKNLELYFDYAAKSLYFSHPAYPKGDKYGWDTDFFVNLGELNYFDAPWQGFSQGKARLSISGASYNSPALALVISGIDGQDLSALSARDTTPPVVSADTGEYSESSLPAAYTGKAYAVFPASAIDDFDGIVPAAASVYFNYWSANKGVVNIFNGRFTPTMPGTYTIVYTASDVSGNEGVKTLDIEAAAAAGDFAFTLAGKPVSVNLGGYVQICAGITPQYSSGTIKYTAEAEHILSGKKYAVNAETWKFFPMDAGTYRVSVTGRDYLSSHTEVFDFTMLPGTVPVIITGLLLPKNFIKNATYTLPDVYGYDFSSGSTVLVKAAIVIKQDGGSELTNAAPNNRYKVAANTTVRVIYRVTAGGASTDKYLDVPVVDTGYTGSANANINMLSYFKTVEGAFTKTADGNKAMFTASGQGAFEFISALQVNHTNGFELDFGPLAGSTAMSAVNVYLTDSEDPSVCVKLRYGKTSGNTEFGLNNEAAGYNLDFDFADPGTQYFRLTYKNALKTVAPVPGRAYGIKTDLGGRPFDGFKSGKVYLKIEAEYASGASGQSGIGVYRINNQPIFNDNRDRNEPQITAFSAKGDRGLNETLIIPASFAADVLDPDVTYTLTVRRDNAMGAIVNSVDNIPLNAVSPDRDYEVALSEMIDYRVYYTASDKNNTGARAATFNYGVTVKDLAPPVITLSGVTETAKKGETVTVATATASKGTVTVYLERPDAVIVKMEGGTFTAESAGVYKVLYRAADAAWNYAVASYQITVS